MEFLELNSTIFKRIQYNNFRRGEINNYLNNKKFKNFQLIYYNQPGQNQSNYDQHYNLIRREFSKYISKTIYICNICCNNVYLENKYKLKCYHNLCYSCYQKIQPNILNQIFQSKNVKKTATSIGVSQVDFNKTSLQLSTNFDSAECSCLKRKLILIVKYIYFMNIIEKV